MLKISSMKRVFKVLVALSVLIFVGCGFMCYNRTQKLDSMRRQLDKDETVLADSRETVKRLDDAVTNYNMAKAKLGALEQGVSSKAYVPTLLKQLEELGRENHLHVVSVRPKVPTVTPAPNTKDKDAQKKADKAKENLPYDKLDVDIEVNGSYWDASRFLRALTTFPKVIAVNNVQVTTLASDKKNAPPALSVKISTTAFILKEDNPPVKSNVLERAAAGDQRS